MVSEESARVAVLKISRQDLSFHLLLKPYHQGAAQLHRIPGILPHATCSQMTNSFDVVLRASSSSSKNISTVLDIGPADK